MAATSTANAPGARPVVCSCGARFRDLDEAKAHDCATPTPEEQADAYAEKNTPYLDPFYRERVREAWLAGHAAEARGRDLARRELAALLRDDAATSRACIGEALDDEAHVAPFAFAAYCMEQIAEELERGFALSRALVNLRESPPPVAPEDQVRAAYRQGRADEREASGMTLNAYQQAASRTLEREQPEEQRLAWNALGLAGEAGEVADLIKKAVYHQHGVDKDKLTKELGDVLWYLAALASVLGLTLEQVAEANIAKLRRRYPEGFSCEASKNRRPEAE
jgi:NTP pyrophosphatase (non-canonical NTP hydrolase)